MRESIKLTLCVLVLSLSMQTWAVTHAMIETSMGNVQLELDEVKTPKTAANFVNYVKKGFYDNTILHRVIDNLMIQGDGFTEKMVQKSTDKAINDEADNGLRSSVDTIATTRIGDPSSATSQFFTNAADNDFLNFKNKTLQGYGYVVFGKVTFDMDVVRRINRVKTATRGFHQDVPAETMIIHKVSTR